MSDEYDFVVQKILAHKRKDKKDHYFVKWKDYGPSHNSWIPIDNFADIGIVNEYWRSIAKSNAASQPKQMSVDRSHLRRNAKKKPRN